MTAIVVYALLSAACYYVAGISSIAEPIRERLPGRVINFLECPYCSGFWYGLAWACLLRLDLTAELAGDRWPTPVVIAIASIMLTPIIAEGALLLHVRYRMASYEYSDLLRDRSRDAASGGE